MREASYVLGTKAEGGVKQNVALVAMVTCCCDTFRGGRDRQVLVRESLSEQKSHVGPVMLSVMVHYYPTQYTIQYTLFRNTIYSFPNTFTTACKCVCSCIREIVVSKIIILASIIIFFLI